MRKRIFVIPVCIAAAVSAVQGGLQFYAAQQKIGQLERDTKGMTEYEVYQYTARHYDKESLKEIGCLDGSNIIEAISTGGE